MALDAWLCTYLGVVGMQMVLGCKCSQCEGQWRAGAGLGVALLFSSRCIKSFSSVCVALRSRVQLSEDGTRGSELPWRGLWLWQHHALRQEHLLKVGVSGYTSWLLIPLLCKALHKAMWLELWSLSNPAALKYRYTWLAFSASTRHLRL